MIHQRRTLSMCMSPMTYPMSYTAEHLAHHFANVGVEHIYIGTYFDSENRRNREEMLMQMIKAWYDKGQITSWNNKHEYIDLNYGGQPWWLSQCLYYAKTTDDFVLASDWDEFVVMAKNLKLPQLLQKNNHQNSGPFCWFVLQSVEVWVIKEGDEDEQYVTRRFTGRMLVSRRYCFTDFANEITSHVVVSDLTRFIILLHFHGANVRSQCFSDLIKLKKMFSLIFNESG